MTNLKNKLLVKILIFLEYVITILKNNLEKDYIKKSADALETLDEIKNNNFKVLGVIKNEKPTGIFDDIPELTAWHNKVKEKIS